MLTHTQNNYQRYYTYIGMATDLTLWNKHVVFPTFPEPNLTVEMASKFRHDALDEIKRQAENFRKDRLYFDPYGYDLQLLEQAIIIMQPRLNCYVRTEPQELFYHGLGLKGVHYFKQFYHNDIPDTIKIGSSTYKLM